MLCEVLQYSTCDIADILLAFEVLIQFFYSFLDIKVEF